MAVSVSYASRRSHLAQLFRDLVHRLRLLQPFGAKALTSVAAAQYGVPRCNQGYSTALMVEESRILEVSIYQSPQTNRASFDFSVVLVGVMTITDEINSQLSQALRAYATESLYEGDR